MSGGSKTNEQDCSEGEPAEPVPIREIETKTEQGPDLRDLVQGGGHEQSYGGDHEEQHK